MSVAIDTCALLEYNAKHRVLICRECKYAIQKGALDSHLLRHKIYRGERQRALLSIAQLQVSEPDKVQLPVDGSPPIDGLPVIPGYACTFADCRSLYASSKRMRRHWSETHGVSEPPDSCARSANLQTFFRGTKLRYFEVNLPIPIADEPQGPSGHGLARETGTNSVAVPPPRTATPATNSGPAFNLDLDTLRYMHHFTIATSLTLPVKAHETAKHWQLDVVEQALRLRWLMYGLLAISASHLAVLSDDESIKQTHERRSMQFLRNFFTGWREEVQHDTRVVESQVAKMAAQIICIHRCCCWAYESLVLGQENIPELVSFQLQSFTATVQGCVDPDFALLSAVRSDDVTEEGFLRVRVEAGRGSGSGTTGSDNAPAALLERLRTLPYRMAEAVGRPDNASDFFATMSAIEVLVECCSLSYASDNMGAMWTGMESWLRKVPEHFAQLVRRQSSAALIVVAHWTILVERAERHCWFLSGSAAMVLRRVMAGLSEDSVAQSLVEKMMS